MKASLLVSPADLRGDRVEVDGDDYRHLFRSRRLGVGDLLMVVDGCGEARRGRVEEVRRDRATIGLGDALQPPARACELTLFAAIARPERASWMVEKGTELGVQAFVFFEAVRGVRPMKETQLQRLRRIAKSALLQCGGARLPELSTLPDAEAVAEGLSGRTSFVLLPGAERRLVDCLSDLPRRAALVIGPEGDFVEEEVSVLDAAGASAVRLGEPVLRLETAAIAGASLLLAR